MSQLVFPHVGDRVVFKFVTTGFSEMPNLGLYTCLSLDAFFFLCHRVEPASCI